MTTNFFYLLTAKEEFGCSIIIAVSATPHTASKSSAISLQPEFPAQYNYINVIFGYGKSELLYELVDILDSESENAP